MDLPELYITTVGPLAPTSGTCAICDRPCEHEDNETEMPYPGGYDQSTVGDVLAPICDPCVERHYPDRVADVEARRLHYWSN